MSIYPVVFIRLIDTKKLFIVISRPLIAFNSVYWICSYETLAFIKILYTDSK